MLLIAAPATTQPGVAACLPMDPVCQAGQVAGAVGGKALGDLADAVTEAVGKVIETLTTFWMSFPTPTLIGDNGQPTDTVDFLQSHLHGLMVSFAVLSVIVAGARTAWEQRGEPIRQLAQSLITLVVVSGAGITAVSLITQGADALAKWILDDATNGPNSKNLGQNLIAMMAMPGGSGAFGMLLVILLGLVSVVSGIVQLALMIARAGILPILAGTLPTAASATNTARGRAWFDRTVAWILAYAAYRPAAAVVDAAAFKLTGSNLLGADGLAQVVSGLMLTALAVFALPALLKLTAPAVSAVSGSGGGGGAFGGAAVAALPTGAALVRSMRSKPGGSGGGTGSSGGGSGGGTGAGTAAGPGGAAATAGAQMIGQLAAKPAQFANAATGSSDSGSGGGSSSPWAPSSNGNTPPPSSGRGANTPPPGPSNN